MSTGKQMSETISKAIYNEVSRICPTKSGWDYVGFDSFGGSVGIPGISLSGGMTGGVLKISRTNISPPEAVKFHCTSFDAGVGLSPVPVNVSFPIPDMPGTGIIYKGIDAQNDNLEPGYFRGAYVSLTMSAGCGPTAGMTFMFLGAKQIPGMNAASFIPRVIATSPAVIISTGISGSLPDAGFTFSLGISV